MYRELWRYRGFILGSVQREFSRRYSHSLLGPLWVFIHPAVTIAVYTVVFSQILAARLPGTNSTLDYGVFLCTGVLAWGLFAEITAKSQGMFLEHAALIKKLSFPPLSLPVAVVLNALINFCIIFALFALMLLALGKFPGVTLVAMLPVVIVLVVLAVGIGLMMGVLNVFFRDAGQFYTVWLQFWFWLTPVVYPWDALSPVAQGLMRANPMAPILLSAQSVVLHRQWPQWGAMVYPLGLGLAFCVGGLYLFHVRRSDMLDEL
jgi:lipopolysaccharide transport system permease protein